jgi:hypothetical protein
MPSTSLSATGDKRRRRLSSFHHDLFSDPHCLMSRTPIPFSDIEPEPLLRFPVYMYMRAHGAAQFEAEAGRLFETWRATHAAWRERKELYDATVAEQDNQVRVKGHTFL